MIFVIIIYVELEDFCLPDALPITYLGSYIFSFVAIIMIRVAQAFTNNQNNFVINTFFVNVMNVTVLSLYGLDVYWYNVQPDTENGSVNAAQRLATVDVEVRLEGAENPMRESGENFLHYYRYFLSCKFVAGMLILVKKL